MSDTRSVSTSEPVRPTKSYRALWVMAPIALVAAVMVAGRLTMNRETIGFLYRPVDTIEFRGIGVPAEPHWYVARSWWSREQPGKAAFWAPGHRYSLLLESTGETPEAWRERVARELATGGHPPAELSPQNPCVLAVFKDTTDFRPGVPGMAVRILLRGGVEATIAGNIEPGEIERIIGRIRCGG